MEDRGIFSGRGFWALALLWLPAGVVAQALVRFAPGLVDTSGAGLFGLVMGAGSLVFVAPCGLPLALGCRRLRRLGYRRAARWAWIGLGAVTVAASVVAGAARSDRDRCLCDRAQPARVGGLVVAGAPRLTTDGGGPAAQQGAGRVQRAGGRLRLPCSASVRALLTRRRVWARIELSQAHSVATRSAP